MIVVLIGCYGNQKQTLNWWNQVIGAFCNAASLSTETGLESSYVRSYLVRWCTCAIYKRRLNHTLGTSVDGEISVYDLLFPLFNLAEFFFCEAWNTFSTYCSCAAVRICWYCLATKTLSLNNRGAVWQLVARQQHFQNNDPCCSVRSNSTYDPCCSVRSNSTYVRPLLLR